MEKIGFKEVFTIDKTREIFNINDFEIAIDKVEKLGFFMEIEKNIASSDKISETRKECIEMLEKIYPGALVIDQKYGDLMQDIINKEK